jgi:hypothetical protein
MAGVIEVVLGGRPREMPVLVMGKSRVWKAELMKSISAVQLPAQGGYTPEWGTEMATAAADQMVELLAAYDITQALSGARTKAAARKWLEDNASDRELFAAFLEVLKATFPFVKDPLAMVMELLGDALREQVVAKAVGQAQRQVAASLTPPSGPSTSGESEAQPISETAGPTSS